MKNLPHDIITDILSRLPVKSLLRFRCVCKSWHALISHSRSFIETHLYQSIENSTTSVICTKDFTNLYCIDYDVCNGDKEVKKLDISFLGGKFSEFRVEGSCNGLLCLIHNVDKTLLLLWNPSTREYKKIPNCPNRLRCLALGYHPIMKAYKVMGVQDLIRESEVMVYTLGGGGSWRGLGKVPWFMGKPLVYFPPILVGGTPYWLAIRIVGHQKVIVSFDVGTEEFQEIQLPNNISGDYGICLGLWKGGLALFNHLSRRSIEVWSMKDYGVKKSWIKQHVFEIPQNTDESLFRCLKNGKILLRHKFSKKYGVYDPQKDKAMEALSNLGFYCIKGIYVSSLVSPPDDKDVIQ